MSGAPVGELGNRPAKRPRCWAMPDARGGGGLRRVGWKRLGKNVTAADAVGAGCYFIIRRRLVFLDCGLTGFYGAAIVGGGKNVTTGGSAYVFVYFPGAGGGWCGVPV